MDAMEARSRLLVAAPVVLTGCRNNDAVRAAASSVDLTDATFKGTSGAEIDERNKVF